MKKITPLFLLLMTLPFWLMTQPKSISFQHLSVEQGLSQGFIHDLLKDREGFIWVGTQDGLNRYNGYNFESFYHEPGQEQSLSNNYIWCLLESKEEHIWIGTNGGGLCRFDKETEQFQTFYPEKTSHSSVNQNSIKALTETPDSTLLVGTEAGLFHFDPTTALFQKIETRPQDSVTLKTIYSFQWLDEENVLVGALAHFYFLNLKTLQLKKAKTAYKINGGIHAMTPDQNDKYWAGTGAGLMQIQVLPPQDSVRILRHFRAAEQAENTLPSNFIAAVYKDQNNVLWLGTNKGLSYLDLTQPEAVFNSFQPDAENPQTLSSELIFSLLEIEPGWMWAGTQEGINQFSIETPIFQTLDFRTLNTDACGVSAHGLLQNDAGTFWLGTENGILQLKPPDEERSDWELECINSQKWPNLGNDFIVNLTAGNEESIWVALRRDGYARLTQTSDGTINIDDFRLPHPTYPNIGTNDVFETKQGDLWVASSGLGLWKWEKNTETFKNFVASKEDSSSLSGNYIFAIEEDSQGNLWIATADGGLCKMEQEGVFECYTNDRQAPQSLSSNIVLSIFEDRNKRIWVCTTNGLNLFLGDGKFKHYTRKDGLPNDLIYGMLEDQYGHLWVSTNLGIAEITYEDSIFTTHNFNANDGLLGNEFNQHAFFQSKDGSFYFGGIGGLTFFKSENRSLYPHPPEIVLSDFYLFNERVPIGLQKNNSSFLLEKTINKTQSITLPYHQNFLAFEYAGLSLVQPEENQYAYKMEGLDEDWVQAGNRRLANYPNLKPGSYTLKIKAANHDGVWNESPKSLAITILPPPWKTWWAYLIYLVAAVLGIYAVIALRVRSIKQIEKAKAAEREEFRKRSARDFHDEAGNKITKIALLTEIAKRQTAQGSGAANLLHQIEEKVQDLRMGMRDFVWVLDPSNDDLYQTLLRLKDFGNQLFEHSQIRLQTQGIDASLQHFSLQSNQRRHLLLIFKEAMHNCLKHAKASEVIFSIVKNKSSLSFTLEDNGEGFSLDDNQEGNGLKNMKTRAKELGGNLVFYNKEGEGTKVALKWQITQMGN